MKQSTDPDSAFCKLCSKSFRIDGGGVSQVKIHQNGKGHQVKEQLVDRNQRKFISNNKNTLQLSLGSFILSQEDQIRRAEIIHAIKCVDSN